MNDDLGVSGWVFLMTILVLLLAMGVLQFERYAGSEGCFDQPIRGEWSHAS